MEILNSKRFKIPIYFFLAICMIAMLKETVYMEPEKYTYFMEKYDFNYSMDMTASNKIPEDGDFEINWYDDNKLMAHDNSERTVFIVNLHDNRVNQTFSHPDFGSGYYYNEHLYLVFGDVLAKWDKDYNYKTKKILKDDVYSRVYIDNLAITSLYRSKGIHAIDLNTEKIIWSIERDKINNHIKLKLVDDKIYYPSYGNIYEVNPYTGEESIVLEDGYSSPLIIEDNCMYTSGRNLKLVDMNNWEVMAYQDINAYTLRTDDKYIYAIIRDLNSTLIKMDKKTLEIMWEVEVFYINDSILELLDNYIAIKNSNNQIGLIDKETGAFVWAKQFPQGNDRAYPFAYNPYLVVGEENGNISFYDTRTLNPIEK